MHCGYMERADWSEPQIGVPENFVGEFCPGWLVRQPAVIDGMRALRWRDQGAYDTYDPGRLAISLEMVEIADAACSQYQAEKLAEMKRR